MPKVILYMALSLDGFIADSNGNIDFLAQVEQSSYEEFIARIGSIIMGAKTYAQMRELSPEWPYPKQQSYIITHKKLQTAHNIHAHNGTIDTLITTLKAQSDGDIWICGGANIAKACLPYADILWLSFIPLTLEKGIRLEFPALDLKLSHTKAYGDVLDVVYNIKR